MTFHSHLPAPDEAAQQHSALLTQQLRQMMRNAGGQIPFSDFMQQALYAPGLGYYSSGSLKFGTQGDFITAPELSPLFGQCVAAQCQQVLSRLPAKQRIVLEFGAGSGRLAVDVLSALAIADCLPAQYWILELSSELQQRQRQLLTQKLPQLVPRVQWLTHLPEHEFVGVILGNEVLDAMPVERFRITADNLERFYVGWEGEQFVWRTGVYDDPMLSAILSPLLDHLPVDYCAEYNALFASWLQQVSGCLRQGLVLLIDYGYPRAEFYHPQRGDGTLMCHYRHHAHADPLILVGLQDITAHVDFTSVAEAASDAGFTVAGYTNQANFLLACGLADYMQRIDPADTVNWMRQTQHVKKLILPSEMGELFKVIALTQGLDNEPLLGFVQDDRGRLAA